MVAGVTRTAGIAAAAVGGLASSEQERARQHGQEREKGEIDP